MSIIDDLLAPLEPTQRRELERIRGIVKQLCHDAEEVKTYGMPGFKYKGKYLLSFGAFKDHLSIFPGAEPIESLKEKLKAYEGSKGTIQFTLEEPIPDELVKEIVTLCMKRIDSDQPSGY